MVTTNTKNPSKPHHKHDAHKHGDQSHAAPARSPRPRRTRPVVRGQDGSQWKDVYQYVLSMSWLQFIVALACVYLVLNGFFATLYFMNPGGIVGARPGSFADCFFFSVQTIGSIGYGALAPKSTYVNLVVTSESFFAILYAAISTGLVFARVSRPFSRVIFSKVAVIVRFEGQQTLMFRAANQRANAILDATATVSLARQITTEEGLSLSNLIASKRAPPRPIITAPSTWFLRWSGLTIAPHSNAVTTRATRTFPRRSCSMHDLGTTRHIAPLLRAAGDAESVIGGGDFCDGSQPNCLAAASSTALSRVSFKFCSRNASGSRFTA